MEKILLGDLITATADPHHRGRLEISYTLVKSAKDAEFTLDALFHVFLRAEVAVKSYVVRDWTHAQVYSVPLC
jgi:hypothetical protein